MLPKATIFDVDGTLCNVQPIRHHILLNHPDNPGYRDFDHFHKASVWCDPIPHVAEAARTLHESGGNVIVVTARRDRYRPHTLAWLSRHNISWTELHHRSDHDTRVDSEVKREILADLRTRYTITAAWDDNPNVIALWEAEGIPVTVVPGWLDDPTLV
jgi:beta-phosphoglucomutase-like phosphatase (HAD superfamily)